MIIISVIFVRRPTRWLAIPLFAISLLNAVAFAHWVWNVAFSFDNLDYKAHGFTFIVHEIIVITWRRACLAVFFVALAAVWGIVSVRLRIVPPGKVTSREQPI
jgi:hypothetical protein